MDADTLERIFEPFFTTKGGAGTGLGLASVHGVVAQLGGHIVVSSQPGMGATFRVFLPGAGPVAEAEAPAAERESLPLSPRRRILICEDDASVRAVVAQSLEPLGHELLVTDSPTAALAVAHQLPRGELDLLITDVIMPEMNGRMLADRVLDVHAGCQRPVMSGHTADVVIEKGIEDSGVNYLEKPFTGGALRRRITELVDGV